MVSCAFLEYYCLFYFAFVATKLTQKHNPHCLQFKLNTEDSFQRAMSNLDLPPISDMDAWVNDVWASNAGGLKARAASVLGTSKSMSVDGGSARNSARSLLLDASAQMVVTSPRLLELMYRVSK